MFTITSLSTTFTSLIFFSFGVYLYFTWRRKEEIFLEYLTVFLLSIGFQQMFFALGSSVFANNFFASNFSWWTAHIFMFLGMTYFVRLPLTIKFPKKEKTILRVVIIYSTVGAIVLFSQIFKVRPVLFANNAFNWRVPGLAGGTIGIFTSLVSLFSVYVFLSEIRKLKNKILKLRSLFLALGILVYYIGGPVHNFVTTPLLSIFADSLLVSGGLIILLGIFFHQISQEKALQQHIQEKMKEIQEAKTTLEIRVRARTKELQELADNLEQQVQERTKELRERLEELERFHQLTVGRELKMIELKKKIKEKEQEIEKLKKRLREKKKTISAENFRKNP